MPTHNAMLLGAIFFFFPPGKVQPSLMLMDQTVCLAAPMQKLAHIPQVHRSATKPTAPAFVRMVLVAVGKKLMRQHNGLKAFGGRRESRAAQWLKPVQKRRSKK